MKKNEKKQSNNKLNDCNKNNVSNKSNNKVSNKNSNDIGFSNESKSFELDRNDEHSFELK